MLREWIKKYPVVTSGLVILIIKLLLWPWAEITDADAVSRIIYAYDLAAGWHVVQDTIWPPAHFYFLALGAEISDNPQVLPIGMHILVSWLGFFTMYAWLKQWNSSQQALFASILFSLSPLALRLGNSPMAESFLIALLPAVLYYLNKRDWKTADILKAGLIMTVTCAFRYEAWLIGCLIGVWLVLEKRYKDFLIFGAATTLFPIYWMLVQWQSTGDFLYGIHGNDVWTHQYLGMKFETDPEILARRFIFFPFSLWIAIGPVAVYLWWKAKITYSGSERHLALVAGLYLLIEIYQSVAGNLMSHHRLTAVLLILSMPFLSRVHWNLQKVAISVCLTIGLSLLYPMEGIGPIPRMKYREVVTMNQEMQSADIRGDKVLIDFIGWDNTYYTLLAQFRHNSIVMSDAMSDSDKLGLIGSLVQTSHYLLVTRLDSPLIELIAKNYKGTEMWRGERYVVLRIEKK
ncbi:MAG: hypothetical protein ACOYLH_11205 [Flavobacteriales bacterium]